MDLSNYSTAQLNELKKDIDKEIQVRRKEDAKKAQQELKQVAERYGFTLSDLVGGPGVKSKTRSPAKVRFQHPADATKTWSGRGRKPAWVKDWEATGRSINELSID